MRLTRLRAWRGSRAGHWLVREDLDRDRLVALLEDFTTPAAPMFALRPPGRFSSATAHALSEPLAVAISARLAAAR